MRSFFVPFAILVGTTAGCSRGQSPGESYAAPSASAVASAASSAAKPWTATSGSFPIAEASVHYVLNPDSLPAYTGPTGSVEGTISVTGPRAPDVPLDVTKCPAALDMYGKLFREGTPATPTGPRTLADAVVVVTGYTGYLPDKAESVHLTVNANCAYPARTIAITYGQRLDISNQTNLLFAPFLDPTSTPAIMVAPPGENGEPVKIYPQQAGHFVLADRMQIFVREDLYVFRHPLHAVTDTSGHYRIDGLPVGKLKLGVYHPGFDAAAEVPLDVVEGVVQKSDVTLTYKPKPARKYVDPTLPPVRLRND